MEVSKSGSLNDYGGDMELFSSEMLRYRAQILEATGLDAEQLHLTSEEKIRELVADNGHVFVEFARSE